MRLINRRTGRIFGADRSGRGTPDGPVRDEMPTRTGRTEAQAASSYACGDQGRRLEYRSRLDTVVVLTVNYADCAVPLCGTALEKSKYVGFGDRIFARMKLKEIDGGIPQGVECAVQFDSTRGNSPGSDRTRERPARGARS